MQNASERLPGVLQRRDGKTWAAVERPLYNPSLEVAKRSLHVRVANTIEKKRIDWLWQPYLQKGAINLITGDPGIGKSTLICEIAAALTRARCLPGQDCSNPPMNIWLMNGEDSAEDTITWRLDNQGADLNRCHITDQVQTINEEVAAEIERYITEHDIKVVFIDPLQAWMGAKLDMNRANETRVWAGLLRSVAQKTGAAIVFVRHRRKGAPGDNSLYAGLGSIDISGFARSEISVLKASSGICYITRTKGNVGRKGDSLSYTIEPHKDIMNDHGIFKWLGHIDPEAAHKKGVVIPKRMGKAVDWLKFFLRDGHKPAQLVFEEALKQGITEATLRRAKTLVADTRQGVDADGRSWYWYLKDEADADDNPLEHTIVGRKAGGADDIRP